MKLFFFAVACNASYIRGHASLKKDDISLAQLFNMYGSRNTREPVGMQITEKTLDPLIKSLSEGCSVRMKSIINGKGPSSFEFGHEKNNCSELKGTLCQITAEVKKEKHKKGINVEQDSMMSGDGCVPSECVEEADLSSLVSFMRKRALEAGAMQSHYIADAKSELGLTVDCSEHGGAVVSIK